MFWLRASSPVGTVRCRWVYDYYERDYQIASVSGDGKVCCVLVALLESIDKTCMADSYSFFHTQD